MCSRSSVQWGVSEYMVRFLEKNKNKKKTSQVQQPSNEKIASSVTELIDFVAFLIFFSKWVYYDVDDLTAFSFVWKKKKCQYSTILQHYNKPYKS